MTRIERRMDAERISKAELARRLGIKQPAINGLWKREIWAYPDTYLRMAQALDVDVRYLLLQKAKQNGNDEA